jgi:hypothetical protein
MIASLVPSSRRVLEPIDRISEVLFGLIMVLTFTGSFSVAAANRDDVRAMLIAALGCNLAWGVIDGVLYLMGCMAERGRKLATFRAVRQAVTPADGQREIAAALPPLAASLLQPAELEAMRLRLLAMPEPAAGDRLHPADYWGAAGVFLLVFLSTLPVAVPFLLVGEAHTALRLSNAVAVLLLFFTGYAFGRASGRAPLVMGVGMVILGLALVGLTIALGG